MPMPIDYPVHFSNDMWVLWSPLGDPWPAANRAVYYKSASKRNFRGLVLNTRDHEDALLFDCEQSGLDWLEIQPSPGWRLTTVPDLLAERWGAL